MREEDASPSLLLRKMDRSSLTRHSRHIRPIHRLDERQQLTLALQTEIAMDFQKFLNDLAVFLRLQAACAVNEDATRFYLDRGVVQQFHLLDAEPLDFFRTNAPAQIHTPPQHTGVGARHIDEHAVERDLRFGEIKQGEAGEIDACYP